MHVCLLASKKYSNTLQCEIDRWLENILKNGKEAARVLGQYKERHRNKRVQVHWSDLVYNFCGLKREMTSKNYRDPNPNS